LEKEFEEGCMSIHPRTVEERAAAQARAVARVVRAEELQIENKKENTMENLEFKDAEKAKAARDIICRVAGEIMASYDATDDKTIESSLDIAVRIFRGANARIKVKHQSAAVAAVNGSGQ
jgi:hypothetical protein